MEHLYSLTPIEGHLKRGEAHSIEAQTRRGNKANTSKWRAILHVEDEPPPLASILAGEILYNLRSALDLLAYQLAIDNCRPKGPPRGTGFPIHDKREKFFAVDAKSESGFAPSSGCHKIRGMPEAARTFIESIQPYHRRNEGKPAKMHPLWLLHDACNADKHIAPHVAARRFRPTVEVIERVNADVTLHPKRGPFKDGDVVATADIFWHAFRNDAKVDIKVLLETEVRFVGGPLDDLGTVVLPEILRFVFEVVFPGLDPGWCAIADGPLSESLASSLALARRQAPGWNA